MPFGLDPGNLAAPWVLILTALDSLGLPSSGDIAVALAAAEDRHRLSLVIALGFTGALIGDNTAYWIGRLGGSRLARRFLRPDRIAGIERRFERHATPFLIFGRMLPGVRAKLVFLAGATRVPYARFLRLNTLGCLIWAVALGTLADAFGHLVDIEAVISRAGAIGLAIVAALITLAVAARAVRRSQRARP